MAEQVQLLRSQGFKILPAITDGTKKLVLSGYLGKESTRKEVVTTLTNLVVNNNFDGIDLDLEGFAFVDGSSSWNKTKPLWTQFIKELSASLREKINCYRLPHRCSLIPHRGEKVRIMYITGLALPHISTDYAS